MCVCMCVCVCTSITTRRPLPCLRTIEDDRFIGGASSKARENHLQVAVATAPALVSVGCGAVVSGWTQPVVDHVWTRLVVGLQFLNDPCRKTWIWYGVWNHLTAVSSSMHPVIYILLKYITEWSLQENANLTWLVEPSYCCVILYAPSHLHFLKYIIERCYAEKQMQHSVRIIPLTFYSEIIHFSNKISCESTCAIYHFSQYHKTFVHITSNFLDKIPLVQEWPSSTDDLAACFFT